MAEALRNLQIFRNGAVITGKTAYEVKQMVDSAVMAGTLTVIDGEPLSIRYQEKDSTIIKGLTGVAYVNGSNKQILWNDSAITINTTPKENSFITLNYSVDDNNNYILTVAYTEGEYKHISGYALISDPTQTITVEAYEALSDEEKAKYTAVIEVVDGLATVNKTKEYIDSVNYEYRVHQDEETPTKYHLQKKLTTDTEGNWEDVDVAWQIDTVVKEGYVKKLGEYTEGEITYKPGDNGYDETKGAAETATNKEEYLVLVIENSEKHIYIKAKDLVDVYTAGDGITIDDHKISVNVSTADNNIITVDENGVYAKAITDVVSGSDTVTVTTENNTATVNVAEAVVERNLGDDSLAVTTAGTLNQTAMSAIENYIDNYDCGTFELTANEMATALTSNINNASTGEAGATTVNDNINVEGQAGSVVINTPQA